MANIEEKTRKALKGLLQCSKQPEFKEDCGDCPYLEYNDVDDTSCIARLCHDAYTVITTLDTTINAMMGAYGDSCDAERCERKGGDA